MLVRAVAQQLDEADDGAAVVAERGHLTQAPEPLARFAHKPACIVGTAGFERLVPLYGGAPGVAVLCAEQQVDRLAQHFRFRPAEHFFRPGVP